MKRVAPGLRLEVARVAERRSAGGRTVALVAALAVVALAAAAVWWPRPLRRGDGPVVVVLDPVGDERRAATTWPALARVLTAAWPTPPRVVIARTRAEFGELTGAHPDFVACPDGVALALDSGTWAPVAAGRRAAPRNLRPRGVLVSRRGAGDPEAPWGTRPSAVVFGDSLSLTATGALRPAGAARAALPAGAAWGPDPYDHAPALHALRLGVFDHAVVRQWDADRFLAQGLLDTTGFTVRPVTVPVPDLVVFAERRLAAGERLRLGQRLAGIGRELADLTPAERDLAAALPAVGLAGFNLLVEPDFDLVRGNFTADWPAPRP
jgi:hypothetical protein